MSVQAFISYSHRDEKWLDLLHRHLVMLKREGVVELWFDKQIDAGGHIDDEVSSGLADSQLFLALVSPDFLASNYCYEKEMVQAIERASYGTMRVVPIILEPCDWKSSPLAQFKALPKDSTPISLWANPNVAMLDIVNELRRVLPKQADKAGVVSPTASSGSRRRVKVKRDFDSIEKADFRDASFEAIRTFFKSSIAEINQIGEPLKARFEEMSPTSFTCTIVNHAQRSGEAHITVHNQKSRSLGDITYTFSPHGPPDSANGVMNVEADEFQLYLSMMDFGFAARDKKLTADQVARSMWDEFIEKAGIQYD